MSSLQVSSISFHGCGGGRRESQNRCGGNPSFRETRVRCTPGSEGDRTFYDGYDGVMNEAATAPDALKGIKRQIRQLERRLADQRFLEASFTSAPLVRHALDTVAAEFEIIERFLAPELDEFFPYRVMLDAIALVERQSEGRRLAPRKAVATVLVRHAEEEESKRRELVRGGLSPDELPIHLLQAIANAPDVVDELVAGVADHFSTAKAFKPATKERRRKQKPTRPQQRAFHAATKMGITSRKSAGAYMTAFYKSRPKDIALKR